TARCRRGHKPPTPRRRGADAKPKASPAASPPATRREVESADRGSQGPVPHRGSRSADTSGYLQGDRDHRRSAGQGREARNEKPFTVSPALARQLDRISERMSREGGIPHEVIVREMRQDMARELKRMVAAYDGSPRKAKDLLEGLLIAEKAGVRGVAEFRRALAGKLESTLGRRRAA